MAESKKIEFALPVGTVITGGEYPYTIEEVLGQGGYGITYKATAKVSFGNIINNVSVAVKEYFPQNQCYRADNGISVTPLKNAGNDFETARQGFRVEAQRLQVLCHKNDNIVRVNEVFDANNTTYYVMEYLDGGSLRELVKNNGGSLPAAKALSVIIPIADALTALHGEMLMHLDVKPDNIVIRKGENDQPDMPVLIDFGISVHFDKKGKPTTTVKSAGVSEGFAPIEQYSTISRFAPEVDVYALAATMLYLLTGKDPQSAFDIKPQHINAALPQNVPDNIRNAILEGMRKEHDERTKSPKQFVASLRNQAPLPIGYILRGGVNEYRISSIDHVYQSWVEYSAMLYSGESVHQPQGGNITLTTRFKVFEWFITGTMSRDASHAVVRNHQYQPADDCPSAGVLQPGSAEQSTTDAVGNVVREVIRTNNTVYCTVKQNWKKESGFSFSVKKKPLVIAACVIAFAVVAGIVWSSAGKNSTNIPENTEVAEVENTESAVIQDTEKDVVDYPVMANDGSVIFKWTGKLNAQNLPTGNGVAKYNANDSKGRKEYHGEMKNGLCDADNAILYYTNGSTYEGAFKDGARTDGMLILKSDEMYYRGRFQDDKEYNGTWFFLNTDEVYSSVNNGKEVIK